MIELPDPASVIPADWRTRSDKEKLAIYAEAWAIVGTNIAHRNWEARQPDGEQLVLPLEEFTIFSCSAANGWCPPSEPEYSLREVRSDRQ